MANAPKNVKKPNSVYKRGKLSKKTRFSAKNVNWKLIIALGCILLSFIFAVVLGNILSLKVENSQGTTTSPKDPSNFVPSDVTKVDPHSKLHAFLADMTGADPEISLSEQTSSARDSGNALFIELRDGNGDLIYSSDRADEIGYSTRSNLTLNRLTNHFAYYNDYALGFFRSDFAAGHDSVKRQKTQYNEILLLSEASLEGFSEILVEFSDTLTKDNLIYYQNYLLSLKLACKNTSVGISLPYSFIADPDKSGMVAQLLDLVDFFAVDLAQRSADEISVCLSSMIYFNERYNAVIMLQNTEDLDEKIEALGNKGFDSYIVR
jgi:hypothetical protein